MKGGNKDMNKKLKKHIPLNQMEESYKKLYLIYPELELDVADTLEVIHKKLNSLPEVSDTSVLNQENPLPNRYIKEKFMPTEIDVVMERHKRYSPPFYHSHEFFEICYLANGNCINRIGNQTIEMKKGDVCLIAPNTFHAIEAFNDDCILFNLLVKVSTFEEVFFRTIVNNDIISSFFSRALYDTVSEPYLLFLTKSDSKILECILEIDEQYKKNYKYKRRMLNALVTLFFVRILQKHERNTIIPNPSGNKTVENILSILNYIKRNYSEVTLKDLAGSFNYSERHMTRILKDYTGKTFVPILREIKLKKCCEMLHNNSLSIQRIVEIAGFVDRSHFYRVFKSVYGMTPVEYREKYLKSVK